MREWGARTDKAAFACSPRARSQPAWLPPSLLAQERKKGGRAKGKKERERESKEQQIAKTLDASTWAPFTLEATHPSSNPEDTMATPPRGPMPAPPPPTQVGVQTTAAAAGASALSPQQQHPGAPTSRSVLVSVPPPPPGSTPTSSALSGSRSSPPPLRISPSDPHRSGSCTE